MIRFIWQNWWRRKERFILLIIGAFIVSAGLTYLIGLSEANKGTIVDNLQQRWAASYDIVVRPEGTRSVTEEKKLLEPNYLSGLSGGISVEQYESIKDIPGVEVAAPIAMIGYAGYEVNFGQVELTEEGIYRRKTTTTVNNGINDQIESYNYYFPYQVWDILNKGPEYGVGAPNTYLIVAGDSLLAGIDPEQEAKLVGLDEAIIDFGTSRYFEETDTYYYNESTDYHEFPIIVNQNSFVDKIESITFERLDIPINQNNANDIMEEVKEKGGEIYLDTIEGEVIDTFAYTGEETFQTFVSRMTGVDWNTGEVMVLGEEELEEDIEIWGNADVTGIVYKPSSLEYREITSPYADRWPYSYQVVPFQNGEDTVGVYRNRQSFREPKLMADNFVELPRIKPSWIGFYDASNLAISKDPTTELPMETYRPATAEFVMDSEGNPMNPPKQLKPTGDPYSFLTDPPGMLTTIEAAEKLLGDKPISAIRIKVAGVTDMSDESQEILEQVASEIENRTGLITDITLGSSPQLALTYVPGLNGESDIGWLQQPWVNIGSSISIFRETKVSFSGVVASVIAVAVVYVWASGIVNLLARRKEFAVLLSIGWRPSQLSRLLFLESSIIGIFVALISWMMLAFVFLSSDTSISLTRFVWTGLFGLIVYVLGSFIPMMLTRNISPYEAMRTGEISGNSKRIFQARGISRMAFNHFIGKWKRSILSVISIALPTALLAVFLYITFRLRGIMYTSLLGEYVALEIGPAHYVAIIVSLIIAILTTAEITWQNISERREEISLLQAIGWRRWSIRRLILAEGFFSGLFAAVIGLSLAFLMMWGLYGAFPLDELGFILATGLIPIIIGLVGTVLPAERAVRIVPNQGMVESYSNRKVTEKRMKFLVISTAVVLAGIFLFTMVKVAPNIENTNPEVEIEQAFSPTEGEIGEDPSVGHEKPEELEGPIGSEPNWGRDDIIEEKYYEVLNEGEDIRDKGSYILSYYAKEIKSDQPPAEEGMKNISIEFSFENLDDRDIGYLMRPDKEFLILVDEERYYPVNVKVLEAENWEDEKLLYGKMRAILDFTVPEDVKDYGLLLRSTGMGAGLLVWFEQKSLEEEQLAAKIYFEEMIKSVEENNQITFMSYQDETNELFYKEQEIWINGIQKKKKEGWDVSVVINDLTLESLNKGYLELQINMKHDDQDISNHITYPIHNISGTWKMNDLPFEKITDGPINLYYLPSLKGYAGKILEDVKEIVELYNQTFDWNPDEVNIKLYDSVEEISASVAWPSLFGVSVPFTSLKFVVQGDYEVAYGFIKHEIVHDMLADISNDNATSFMQEGLAMFISDAVTEDDSGKLQLDFTNTADREKIILETTEEIKTISDFEDVNYTVNSKDIYGVGFLITNYLIQTYGIEKYLEMVGVLKSYSIIDYGEPNKEQIEYQRTIEALEQIYGPLDILSEEYIDYYNKRK